MTVYFLQGKEGGPVKIGHSGDEVKRLQELQVASPVELVCIRAVGGGDLTEAWFHKRFQEQHIRGEWFDFHKEMLTLDAPPSLQAIDLSARSAPEPINDYVSELTSARKEAELSDADIIKVAARQYLRRTLAEYIRISKACCEIAENKANPKQRRDHCLDVAMALQPIMMRYTALCEAQEGSLSPAEIMEEAFSASLLRSGYRPRAVRSDEAQADPVAAVPPMRRVGR